MKRALKLFLFVLVVLASNTAVFAQDSGNSLDKLYVPIENSIFNSKGGKEEASGSYNDHKSIIFFNPLLLVRNIGALHYQRQFTEEFAVVGGIGSAFGKDKIMQLGLTGEGLILSEESYEHSAYQILESGDLSSSMNLFLSLGTKLYYDSFWGFDMAYVQIDYRYSSQNFDYSVSSSVQNGNGNYSTLTQNFDVGMSNHNVNILFGAETHSGDKLGIYHSIYYRFGVRSLNYDEIATVSVSGSNSGLSNLPSLTGEKINTTAGVFLLGYRLGFGF